ATNAITPGVNTPADVCHQGDAGMSNTALPEPASVGRRPVRWWMGGAKPNPRSDARIRSIPSRPRKLTSAYPPRTGSFQISSLIGARNLQEQVGHDPYRRRDVTAARTSRGHTVGRVHRETDR